MESSEINPGEILELSGIYWQTCTLHAGVKLDIFTIIGDGWADADHAAGILKADERGVEMLLNALSAMSLIRKKGTDYENTPLSRTYLCSDSEQYIGHMIMHHHHLMASWNQLADTVVAGGPVEEMTSWMQDEEQRESFLMGMFNNAVNAAPKIMPLVDLSGCDTLLDLGGGPGTYAIHFCKAYPDLSATVFDLDTTEPFFEKTVASFGLEDRIMFQPGDYKSGNIRGTYDAVWMSHILHGEDYENCCLLLGKAFDVLNPGGLIVIHDFVLNDTRDSPLFPALFSLNMYLRTKGGKAYSRGEIVNMLEGAGFKDISFKRVDNPNDSGLVFAKK
ncbi:MAG: methyltransferase [Desulfobacteraceae bacterium]